MRLLFVALISLMVWDAVSAQYREAYAESSVLRSDTTLIRWF
jgi:hypothetical protein